MDGGYAQRAICATCQEVRIDIGYVGLLGTARERRSEEGFYTDGIFILSHGNIEVFIYIL